MGQADIETRLLNLGRFFVLIHVCYAPDIMRLEGLLKLFRFGKVWAVGVSGGGLTRDDVARAVSHAQCKQGKQLLAL